MSKPRGTVERSRKLASLRHVVEIPLQPDALGEHLSAMHSWSLKRCGPGGYLDSARIARDEQNNTVEFVRFHFPDAAAARDFAARFGQVGAKLV